MGKGLSRRYFSEGFGVGFLARRLDPRNTNPGATARTCMHITYHIRLSYDVCSDVAWSSRTMAWKLDLHILFETLEERD